VRVSSRRPEGCAAEGAQPGRGDHGADLGDGAVAATSGGGASHDGERAWRLLSAAECSVEGSTACNSRRRELLGNARGAARRRGGTGRRLVRSDTVAGGGGMGWGCGAALLLGAPDANVVGPATVTPKIVKTGKISRAHLLSCSHKNFIKYLIKI
jgi:hypothetical protein